MSRAGHDKCIFKDCTNDPVKGTNLCAAHLPALDPCCWHPTGRVGYTQPLSYFVVCCHCGALDSAHAIDDSLFRHGPHAPANAGRLPCMQPGSRAVVPRWCQVFVTLEVPLGEVVETSLKAFALLAGAGMYTTASIDGTEGFAA